MNRFFFSKQNKANLVMKIKNQRFVGCVSSAQEHLVRILNSDSKNIMLAEQFPSVNLSFEILHEFHGEHPAIMATGK